MKKTRKHEQLALNALVSRVKKAIKLFEKQRMGYLVDINLKIFA